MRTNKLARPVPQLDKLEPRVEMEASAVPSLRFEVAEAAHILRMSRAQLYNRIQDGSINPQKDGTRTYITRAELERYVEACSSIKGAAPRRRDLPSRNRAPDERA
jgi:excisionase family DNA binding protein